MVYILLGGLGFLIGYSLELLPVQKLPGAKPLLGTAAAGLLAFSLGMVSLHGGRLWLPAWLSALGGGLLSLASLLLVYSLFLELPLRVTYIGTGPGPRLVTRGTYALVRHPTVLWYGLLLLSTLLLTRSHLLLIGLPVWLALDILWAVLQERVSLPQTFPHYQHYQQVTPMLIPNLRSLRACLVSLRSPKGSGAGLVGR
ncbi:hypothetical protein ACFLX9_02260 [Chloroflexota bacterium]